MLKAWMIFCAAVMFCVGAWAGRALKDDDEQRSSGALMFISALILVVSFAA